MKYRDKVRELLTNVDVRTQHLIKMANGTTQSTQEDAITIIKEIGYTSEKIRELIDLENNEIGY